VRAKFWIALATIALCAALPILLFLYPRYLKVRETCEEGLKGAFRRLYESDPEFRASVDGLRKLALDPDVPYNRAKALKLFNTILRKLGLPETSPIHFRYGKSVKEKAPGVPRKVTCAKPSTELRLRVLQPSPDVENGNGLKAVYVCGLQSLGGEVIEVTLVFSDEDKPPAGSLEDLWYDVWRLVTWGRLEDIETLYVVNDGHRLRVEYRGLMLVLNGTLGLREIAPIGSGLKRFTEAAHVEDIEVASTTLLELYVNTWNHAIGLRDNNPDVEKVVFGPSGVDVRVGSRLDAENDYSDLVYVGEVPGSVPG